MELSGRWVAKVADDDVRREGVYLEHDDDDWPEIAVPGHWRNDLQFAATDGPLLYRHRFHLDPPPEGERRWVTFDGILYQADVWLDGAYLGDPEGYFFPHSFDITGLARLSSDHVLAVEVACPPPVAGAPKRTITGALQVSDAIDPSWNPGGLWRPVRIEHTGAVRMDRLRVLCRDANDARAHLRLHARLDADRSREITVRTAVDGVVLDVQSLTVAAGSNEIDWSFDVNEPRLWWPWSLGDQHLTDVDVEVSVDGAVSDRRQVRTGLREVAMHDWVLSVNGERLFVKGANVAPTRAALADATPDEVRRDVELAREAGLDLIRVHAHIARPELYAAADELGMLVWQDFPLQWGYARSVRRQAVRQAREAVDLLGHHPSIALWCAHNEPSAVDARADVHGGGIARLVARQQLPSWNTSILDRWVKRAFETADESRATIAHSGVAPHLPLLDGTTSHLFFGWYHGDPRDLAAFAATVPRMVRFVSEFGAQAVPNDAEFMQPERWPDLDWAWLEEHHGLQLSELEAVVPRAAHFSFDSWRDATQRHQAEVLRLQIETLRRLKYRPAGGFCFLALNDSQPAVSWSVLDHERHPKLGYAAVIEACRSVIVVADPLPADVTPGDAMALDVHVISDLRRPLDDVHCTAMLRWPGGDHRWSWDGNVPPDSVVRVGTIQLVAPDVSGELWLDLTLEHDEGAVTNRYTATIGVRALMSET